MERIKLKKLKEQQQSNTAAYPMKSVMDDMDPNERQALKDGSRKRKAPVEDQKEFPDKNLQRKKVNAKQVPKPGTSDDADEDPYQEMRQLV